LYKGERLGQGRENAKATLKQRTELADKLEQELRAKYLVGPAAQAAAEAAAEREEAAAKAELEAAEKSSAKPAKAAR
ncbi:MAG: DNA recombination/repair protein RecA, partial [Elusimicrobia bacterium]|nr:DNA recombination/repair protein RecA [Elusimicrobiota bacterium]